MILHPVTTKSLMTNHRTIKKYLLIFKMKNNLKILVIFFSWLFTSQVYAGIYYDWPDDAICTWLEQRPNHEGYLKENKTRVTPRHTAFKRWKLNSILGEVLKRKCVIYCSLCTFCCPSLAWLWYSVESTSTRHLYHISLSLKEYEFFLHGRIVLIMFGVCTAPLNWTIWCLTGLVEGAIEGLLQNLGLRKLYLCLLPFRRVHDRGAGYLGRVGGV